MYHISIEHGSRSVGQMTYMGRVGKLSLEVLKHQLKNVCLDETRRSLKVSGLCHFRSIMKYFTAGMVENVLGHRIQVDDNMSEHESSLYIATLYISMYSQWKA